jgi:site-specific recombinase XerD
MTPENADHILVQHAGGPRSNGHGRQPAALGRDHEAILSAYASRMQASGHQGHSARTYISAARGYLHWLEMADVGGDPLANGDARDQAVREYLSWLQTGARRSPATVNKSLAVLNDFYLYRGMGKCDVNRVSAAPRPPHVLSIEDVVQYLQTVHECKSSRDRAIALLPLCAGSRVSEVAALDVRDIKLLMKENKITDPVKGEITFRARSEVSNSVPIHADLRVGLSAWLGERGSWLESGSDQRALFISKRGGRLTTDALSDIIKCIAEDAKIDAEITIGVLRRTFENLLLKMGGDRRTVAHLTGRAGQASVSPHYRALAKAVASLPRIK